jgi:hypothetical protein
MAKTKTRVDVTDAEIDAAIARGKVYDAQHPPVAIGATYRGGAIEIRFATGVEVRVPAKLLQGLQHASDAERAAVELLGGEMLHWETLDVDHYIPMLLAGIFGSRRWMSEIGKRGGSVRSDAKTRAARRNGRKGGRPRKAA